MPLAPLGAMAGKRAYSLQVQKKGSRKRKLRASGLEWFVLDTALEDQVRKAPRGHRKAPRTPSPGESFRPSRAAAEAIAHETRKPHRTLKPRKSVRRKRSK